MDALTVSAISAEAGVYSSAIFYHFGGKEALWMALIDQLLREANAETACHLSSLPLGRERVVQTVVAYDMIGGRELQSSFLETLIPALRSDNLRKSLQSLYEEGIMKLAADLGADEHPDHRDELRLIGQIVLAFTDGLDVQHLVSPDADFSPAIALFQEMIFGTPRDLLGIDEG
jgi:AcrR family transcriptional regulator